MSKAQWERFAVVLAIVVSTGTACRPPVVHDILSFDDQVTSRLNRSAAGTAQPSPAQCVSPLSPGADPSLGFLREFSRGSALNDAKIPFEWAPVVPGPVPRVGDHLATTVHTPEFFASGRVVAWDTGAIDVRFSHPFGYRKLSAPLAVDQSVDVKLDPLYDFLRLQGGPADSLHVELEAGAWPVRDFGFVPQIGDRIVMKGNWIMDCGHPENWGAEIHPPTFLALARVEGGKTISHAFVNPYRVTQLYVMDPARAVAFDDEARYTDPLTYPFARFFFERIDDHKNLGNFTPVFAHAIIEATQFTGLSWYVCAGSQPVQDAQFEVRYHFTTRSGVGVQVVSDPGLGCARILAAMGPAYTPMPLARLDYKWSWDDINAEANTDIRQKVKDAIFKAYHDAYWAQAVVDHVIGQPAVVDQYAPLKPIGGAADSTQGIVTSDAQPFPFYGWTQVYWKRPPTTVPQPPVVTPIAGFNVDPAELDFVAYGQSLSLTLTPGSGAPPIIQSVTIAGTDAGEFSVVSDACAGLAPPSGGCKITVTFRRATHVGLMQAKLQIRGTKGGIEVPLKAPGLISE